MAFRGNLTVVALVEYLQMWERLQAVMVQQGRQNGIVWRGTASGIYIAKSAYDLFFLGRTSLAGAKQMWDAKAPLKHKMHLWLVLRDRLWTADRLARRGL
jgi:hypothetical protein